MAKRGKRQRDEDEILNLQQFEAPKSYLYDNTWASDSYTVPKKLPDDKIQKTQHV